MKAESAVVATPAGPFTVVLRGGAVVGSGWTTDVGDVWAGEVVHRRELGAVTNAVEAYVAGDVAAIDEVPVHQTSGPYIEHAWATLRQVAPGRPITYTEFAARAGRPAAVRAAAMACGRNRAALFVPCHRIVGTDGTLRGFRWGLPVKRWLLDHEAVRSSASSP
jgi:methylated-DNA-[protein]-cysteine S-methyltransferase